MIGRSEVCIERRDGRRGGCRGLAGRAPRPPRRPRRAAIAALLAGAVRAAGGCAFGRCLVFILVFVEDLVLAVLFVEVQLDAVIEMRFLQHFAQFAGANLRGQRLFFVIVQVVLVGLVVARMRSGVELLAFDHFFFNQAAPGA